MEPLVREILSVLQVLDFRGAADILIVAGIIYWLLTLIQGTTAVMLVRGVAIVFIAGSVLSNLLSLSMLGWLVRNAIPAALVAVPILFQPELRRALEQVGRAGTLLPHRAGGQAVDSQIESIVGAAKQLSARHWGALIVIARDTGLGDYTRTGVPIDGALTEDLMLNIFYPGSPLHDGAVVVQRGRLAAAGCVLPLSSSAVAPHAFGTRHRAALGITEQTDAVCVVVSEETGRISIANAGRLVADLDGEKLSRVLTILCRPAQNETLRTFWRPRQPASDTQP